MNAVCARTAPHHSFSNQTPLDTTKATADGFHQQWLFYGNLQAYRRTENNASDGVAYQIVITRPL